MASFPTSKYARYKRATAFFLDWLLRARGRGRRSGKRVQLDEFNDVVQEIAAKPSTLTPKLLGELPKALAACQCSITFREHVATFFADDQEGHRHFLGLLKKWLASLKQVETQQTDGTVKIKRFENYYEVLQVDEDYFPDEETFVVEKRASKRAKVDRELLFDQAFAEDLRLEIAYFFLELEELVEEVFDIYEQVKKQERTMMEATVVVKVAMDLADSLTAGLQFRYPALQTAEDLLFVLMDHPSTSMKNQIAKAAADVQANFEKDGTYKFAPGMLLNDFTNVWWTLASFSSSVAAKEDRKDTYWNFVVLPDDCYGEKYGEERTPQYVLPDSSNMIVFLLQQLPMLYNTIRWQKIKTGSGYERAGLTSSFMALFDEFFETRKVTIPLVFACICWIKSVSALQGGACLSRNVSLTFKHSRELVKKMELTVEKSNTTLQSLIQNCTGEIKGSIRGHTLARTNPLMAGFMMVTHHIKFLLLASGVLLKAKKLRAFGHLYNALVNEGFLQHIPFFEELLAVYDDIIFKPSRATAVHGAYNRVYLLSEHHSAATVESVYRGVPPPRRAKMKTVKDPLDDFSMTYRLVFEDDLSCLRGVSPKAMLKKAADFCSKELYATRILSRDLMTLNDDLTDAFSKMCDELGRRQFHDDYIADPVPSKARQKSIEYGLVDAVMVPLVALLDARQHNGSMKWSALPVGMLTHRECAVSGEHVRKMGQKVAAVIKTRFATSPLFCENKYFTLPSKLDYVNQEYGTALQNEKTDSESREQVFFDLMALMKNTSAPLSRKDLNYLKAEIKADPELLGVFSPCTTPSTHSSTVNSEGLSIAPGNDLSTLFHLAAGGPAHDLDLVEWMIQMGALIYQPIHCRKEPSECELTILREQLPNTMALHSAVIAGYDNIARLMLEADNMIDLNTPTFHTKETLSHLAARHGHRDMLNILRCFGANTYIKDGNGRCVRDMTAERGWSTESAEIAASTPECEETAPVPKDDKRERNFDSKFCRQITSRAERLRKLVFIQRDEERQLTLKNVGTATETVLRSKKKKKKKGNKGRTKDWKVNRFSTTTSTTRPKAKSSPDVDLSTHENDSGDCLDRSWSVEKSIAKTSIIFARLRDPNIPATDKYEDVECVSKVIERLEGITEVLTDPIQVDKQDVLVRSNVSFEAYRVIHMMQKFHRVDHAAVEVPILAPLRQLCATTTAFTKFLVRTAQLCISVSRKSQALEILDVLEKRLLKAHRNHERSDLRRLFQMYSGARDILGLGRTTSANVAFLLDWYVPETIETMELQMSQDKMTGRPFYFELTAKADTTNRQFHAFTRAITAISELSGVACFDKYVMYGGKVEDDVARVLQSVLGVAQREGIQFDSRNSQPCTSADQVGQFLFSSVGGLRNAATA